MTNRTKKRDSLGCVRVKEKVIRVLISIYSHIKDRLKIGNWLYDWLVDKTGTNQGRPKLIQETPG